MFKKFVFFPPLFLALVLGALTAYSTVQGLMMGVTLVEVTGHVTAPSTALSTSSPTIHGMYQGEPFTCTCAATYCREELPDGELLVLLEPDDLTTCYDVTHERRPDDWGFSLAMTALMALLAWACVKALRAQGARTH